MIDFFHKVPVSGVNVELCGRASMIVSYVTKAGKQTFKFDITGKCGTSLEVNASGEEAVQCLSIITEGKVVSITGLTTVDSYSSLEGVRYEATKNTKVSDQSPLDAEFPECATVHDEVMSRRPDEMDRTKNLSTRLAMIVVTMDNLLETSKYTRRNVILIPVRPILAELEDISLVPSYKIVLWGERAKNITWVPGDIVEISAVTVSEYHGELQLKMNDWSGSRVVPFAYVPGCWDPEQFTKIQKRKSIVDNDYYPEGTLHEILQYTCSMTLGTNFCRFRVFVRAFLTSESQMYFACTNVEHRKRLDSRKEGLLCQQCDTIIADPLTRYVTGIQIQQKNMATLPAKMYTEIPVDKNDTMFAQEMFLCVRCNVDPAGMLHITVIPK